MAATEKTPNEWLKVAKRLKWIEHMKQKHVVQLTQAQPADLDAPEEPDMPEMPDPYTSKRRWEKNCGKFRAELRRMFMRICLRELEGLSSST